MNPTAVTAIKARFVSLCINAPLSNSGAHLSACHWDAPQREILGGFAKFLSAAGERPDGLLMRPPLRPARERPSDCLFGGMESDQGATCGEV